MNDPAGTPPEQPVNVLAESLPRLVTCSYTGYRRDMGTAVRTSLGAPRFITLPNPQWSTYSRWPYIAELAPRQDYMKAPYDTFRARYLDQLDTWSADILRKLTWIPAEHGALCLLCFEKAPLTTANWCHRRLTAEWFQTRYGITVPEMDVRR